MPQFKEIIMFLMGVVVGFTIMGLIKSNKTLPPNNIHCSYCHTPPIIKGYSDYRRFHRNPNADDIKLANELAEQTYIINQLLGARNY